MPTSTKDGADMFLLPLGLPRRPNDSVVDMKGEARPSGLTLEEKGKTKMVSVVTFSASKKETFLV